MTSQVKQLVLLSLLNIAAVVSKVSSSLKTTIHEAFSFWYHINKIHTQRSTSLLLPAKILSQPGIQLCVATVAVQSWQTAFHGLCERLPCPVQHSCLIWTQITLVIRQIQKNIPVTLWYGERVNQPVFSNRRHCCVSAWSPTVWL
jgi:hypothetical protein